MPRYIDRDKLIKIFQRSIEDPHNQNAAPYSWSYAYECMQDLVEDLPTADLQEVVRCRECKFYKESKLLSPNKFCFRLRGKDGEPVGYNFSDDDFCSRGERIEA